MNKIFCALGRLQSYVVVTIYMFVFLFNPDPEPPNFTMWSLVDLEEVPFAVEGNSMNLDCIQPANTPFGSSFMVYNGSQSHTCTQTTDSNGTCTSFSVYVIITKFD